MTACAPSRLVVQTRTIEVPVPQYVGIPKRWTVPIPVPPAPDGRCIAEDGEPTMCGDQLDTWIEDGWAEALNEANRQLQRIACLSTMVVEGKGEEFRCNTLEGR